MNCLIRAILSCSSGVSVCNSSSDTCSGGRFVPPLVCTPTTCEGAARPTSGDTEPPRSPPCTPYRVYPSSSINDAHTRPIRGNVQSPSVVGPENPNPGSAGITTWNASEAWPPYDTGSVSGPIRSRNSTIDPGQPCVSKSGKASGEAERTWMKWIRCPSISVVNWGYEFSSFSAARQSYDVRQYSTSDESQDTGTPVLQS